jgi:hypothetical protein
MKWVDGGEYHGNWKGNVRDGYGVYTSPNGKKEAGNWKNNKLVTVARGRILGLCRIWEAGMNANRRFLDVVFHSLGRVAEVACPCATLDGYNL